MQNKTCGREGDTSSSAREGNPSQAHSLTVSAGQQNRTLLQLSMNLTAPLLLLSVALMVTMVCSSISCPSGCDKANYTHQYFKHVSELQDNPMAPWELKTNSKIHRNPEKIQYAECKPCKDTGMIAKPICFQISVYETVWEGGERQLCRCPFKVAVGCTCVNK